MRGTNLGVLSLQISWADKCLCFVTELHNLGIRLFGVSYQNVANKRFARARSCTQRILVGHYSLTNFRWT
jgi:hypothetical protein